MNDKELLKEKVSVRQTNGARAVIEILVGETDPEICAVVSRLVSRGVQMTRLLYFANGEPFSGVVGVYEQKNKGEIVLYPRWTYCSSYEEELRDIELQDLYLLKHLESVKILSNEITDYGVELLCRVQELRRLTLRSNKITNECLKSIPSLKNLELLDLQGNPNLTKEAVLGVKSRMLSLRDVFV